MNLEWVSFGVTRWVLLIGPFAFKIPKHIRGWMANQSEWRQRRKEGVNGPLFTLFHFLTIYWRAEATGRWDTDECPFRADSNEERKGSSWGSINGTWLLIDFDRAWMNPRSLVSGIYYGNQERLSRKWMKLPRYEEDVTEPRTLHDVKFEEVSLVFDDTYPILSVKEVEDGDRT